MVENNIEIIDRKSLFLKNYERFGCALVRASKESNISPQTIYRWKKEDTDFSEKMEVLRETMIEKLEAAALNRAAQGDSVMMIFLLKAFRPHIYRDFYSGSVQNTGIFIVPKEMSIDQWKKLFEKKEVKENEPSQLRENKCGEIEVKAQQVGQEGQT